MMEIYAQHIYRQKRFRARQQRANKHLTYFPRFHIMKPLEEEPEQP
jgi:hypothetical protein